MAILKKTFFERSVLTVAKELLGKFIVYHLADGSSVTEMIVETEAYDGECDLACHAAKGRTKRTEIMYGEAMYWYVYLCYGIHAMLNIVTGKRGYPAAVLIRSTQSHRGPGVLTKAMGITVSLNGKMLGKKSGYWIEDRGVVVQKYAIKRSPRIGVAYAGVWATKPYRFIYNP